jgi:hypothetical protein
MADRQSWRPILFRCPQTGHKVSGLIATDISSAGAENYEPVSCIACSGVHHINALTGAVLGMPRGESN